MTEKCYAPIFTGTRSIFACFYLMIIYTIIIMVLMLSLIWLTAEGRCLIKQYLFRIKHCKRGNNDPNRLI